MKKQGGGAKISGEEREHDISSIFKKFFETAKKSPISADVLKSAGKTVSGELKAAGKEAVNQVGARELIAGHAISLNKPEKHADAPPKAEKRITSEHMDYFSEFKKASEGNKNNETSIAIKSQLDAILAELRNLKASSDELENVFKDVVVDEVPDKPGIYHLTFYEGFLKLVLKMKDKVEDGVVYAKLFKGRKQERTYSSMAKKGGTSFTLHHDRAVATQTG